VDFSYTFYISQGAVATQLRCGGIFINHFTTNFSQNAPGKKMENRSIFGKDMDRTLWLTFWATLYYRLTLRKVPANTGSEINLFRLMVYS